MTYGRAVGEAIDLGEFNALPAEDAHALLLACCASPRWAGILAEGRPYGSVVEILEASDAALAGLDGADIEAALAGHARIGEAADGAAGKASRQEQAGVADAPADIRAALAAGNRAYEERFGQVYLVSAAGRSADALLARLRERLANDAATERRVLRDELGTINRRRLDRLLRS